jgi:hypothetical protein
VDGSLGDALSAASLFLAVLGLLFGAWYPEICKAISLSDTRPPADGDRGPQVAEVSAALWYRTVPLIFSSSAFCAILIAATIQAIRSSYEACEGPRECQFDTVKAFLIAVHSAGIYFAAFTIRLACRLVSTRTLLRTPTPGPGELPDRG